MRKMRAKMVVRDVDTSNSGIEVLTFSAVGRNEAYPADGSDENNTFAKWTPTADMTMNVANPELHGKFSVGDTFYVDFTPAPK